MYHVIFCQRCPSPVWGLVGYRFLAPKWRMTIVPLVVLVGLASLAINLIGALHGSMLCDFPSFAAHLFVSQKFNDELRAYSLAAWLLGPFMILIAFLAWTAFQAKHTNIRAQ